MRREKLIKVFIIVIAVVFFSFSDWSLAAEDTASLLDITAKWLHLIVSLLSWIWILFAQWAWEFMTNKWVYGEFIWLDAILWKYWNVVKNIANFWLGFYFVYIIFKWLIDSKSDVVKKLKDSLLWILIAWIWIQTSWFLVAAIVDVSTITLVAVSSLPSQIVSTSPELKHDFDISLKWYFIKTNDMAKDFEKWVGISLYSQNQWAFNFLSVNKDLKLDKPIKEEELFDQIMPNGDSVSWPLHYLWLTILKSTSVVSLNSATTNWLMGTIFNIVLQSLTSIVYSLEMMVLFVVAVIRVVYIRIFVVLSPIVFLLRCIKKWDNNFKLDFLNEITTNFNLSSFFWNVFKPSIIVLWFSLAIIFATVMNSVIQSNDTLDIWWVKSSSLPAWSTNWNEKHYITTIDTDMVWFTFRSVWKTILDFIMCIITVILVYYIIKIAVLMWDGKDFVSTKIQSLQKNVWDLMWALPVMPVAWYDKNWNPKTRYLTADQVLGRDKEGKFGLANSMIWQKINRYQWQVNDKYRDQNKIMQSWFGDETWYLSTEERKNIEQKINQGWIMWEARLENTLKEIKKLRTEEWKWMTLSGSSDSSKFWIQTFEGWLTDMVDNKKTVTWIENAQIWNSMIAWWGKNKDNRTLEGMFNGGVEGSVSAYAQFFFDADDKRSRITRWQDLQLKDISKSKESEEESEEKSENE